MNAIILFYFILFYASTSTSLALTRFHFRVFSREWLVGIGNVLARIDGDNGLGIKWLR